MTAHDIPETEWVARWPQVRLDQFKGLDHMQIALMDALNTLCARAMTRNNWRHRINSDYREGDTGQHGRGNAVDLVFFQVTPGDVDEWEQFDFAVKSRLFLRIGIYPHWNAPGIHVDMKPARLYWLRTAKGVYRYAMTPGELRELA